MDTIVVGIRDPLTKSHVESLTGLYLTPIGKRYVPMGFNGFYYNDIQAEPEALTKLVTFSLFLNREVTEEGVEVIAKIGSHPSRQVFRYVNNGESLFSDYGFTYPVPDELKKAQKLLDDNKGVIIIL